MTLEEAVHFPGQLKQMNDSARFISGSKQICFSMKQKAGQKNFGASVGSGWVPTKRDAPQPLPRIRDYNILGPKDIADIHRGVATGIRAGIDLM
jgi:hypothetical protein